MCSLTKARHCRKHKGFLLIELVIVFALILLMQTLLLPSLDNFIDKMRNMQLKSNAYIMATDIRRTQSASRYRGDNYQTFIVDQLNAKYSIQTGFVRIYQRKLSESLGAGWKLKAVASQMTFYQNGHVSNYNYIDVINSKNKYVMQVQVLPVTARVGVYVK